MELRQPDTKRKVGFGRDEAGRDAKRLCQLTETSRVAQPLTESSTFFDLALQAAHGQGLIETDNGEHLNNSPVFELFQYTENVTPPAPVQPDCSIPSASAYYGDQVEKLLFDGEWEPQFEPFTHTNYPEWDELDYSGLDLIPSPDSNYRTTRQGDTITADDEVEAEPIDAKVTASSNSVGATSVSSDHNVGYDACFGVIVARAICSTNKDDSTSAPVNIKRAGGILKLYFEESSKYAGILTMPVLCRLLEGFEVKFKAFLTSSKPESTTKDSKRKKDKGSGLWEYSIRILVYGLISEKDAVGDLLTEADVHLQQPRAMEYDISVEYSNPHYLVRPGGQMPKLEGLYLDSDVRGDEQPLRLSENTKGRLLRILDSANGLGASASVTASPRLRSDLMDHQKIALAMMVEKEGGIIDDPKFPPLWVQTSDHKMTSEYRHIITGARSTCPTPINGGILADDMGLGKTLSMLALICSSLDMNNSQAKNSTYHGAKTTLIVTPKSTISGWEHQIARHIYSDQVKKYVYHGSNRQRSSTELHNFDIVLTTYETLRSDFYSKGPLYSAPWFRLVLDEAHHIRNRSSQVFSATCGVRALYRWCLTGTPIQNSLDDYGALLSFLNIHSFREKSEFDFWVASSIKEPKHDSMNRLKSLVNATCLRRTKRTPNMNIDLPDREERIEHITLSRHDQKLYDFFKGKLEDITSGASKKRNSTDLARSEDNILALITILRRICNHGEDLLPAWASKSWRDQSNNAVNWNAIECRREICDRCGEEIDMPELLDSPSSRTSQQFSLCDSCRQIDDVDNSRVQSPCMSVETSATTIQNTTSKTHPTLHCRPSAKVDALLKNLRLEQKTENARTQSKSVVFTSWVKMLDLIEIAIKARGFGYERLDGQTSLKSRGERIQRFNEDSQCTVMLATIGSTGEGVDFTAANHIHLVEPHWNPMAEAQAVDRVHRIGQTRPVTITRYIVPKSIETYIQWVQEDKVRLINQSINDTDDQVDNRDQMLQNLRAFSNFVNKSRSA